MPDKIAELVGTGAGGGILAAILTWVGFKSRLDAVERAAVSRETCAAVQRESIARTDALQHSLDSFREDVGERLGRIEARVDAIYRNGKGVGPGA